MVLLDACTFVVDVKRGRYALGDDSRSEPTRCAFCDTAFKDQLDLIRPADIKVLADYLLEEEAACNGTVKHLRERELRLQNGDGVLVACGGVSIGVRVRQVSLPFMRQVADLFGGQRIGDFLHPFWVFTG